MTASGRIKQQSDTIYEEFIKTTDNWIFMVTHFKKTRGSSAKLK